MSHTLPIQHLLQSRYRIEKVIGQGGFGITYKAFDERLEKTVCVKELFVSGSSTRGQNFTVQSQSTGGLDFGDFKNRFLQEARKLARFKHPHIVKVIDVFEENQTAYMVMEFVEGITLKQKVENQGKLSFADAKPIMLQLLDAVEEVHRHQMLHRDIKPENVLWTPDEKVILIDFGSARDMEDGKTLTQTALLTPGFAPPEQYSHRAKRDTYTDIYALGATFYYLFTGEKPLPAIDRYRESTPPPHHINIQISSQLSSAIMLAMELKPEDRFQTIIDFRNALLEQKEKSPPTPPIEEVGERKETIWNKTFLADIVKYYIQYLDKLEDDFRRIIGLWMFISIIILILFILFLPKSCNVDFYKKESKNVAQETASNKSNLSLEESAFETAKQTDTKNSYELYLNEYPNGKYKNTAQNKLDSIRQQEKEELKKKELLPNTVTDIDGNTYKTVKFGDQIWMAENLRTSKYSNGDPIPNITSYEQWKNLTTGAWCWYDNKSKYDAPYGKLYNWYAVADRRNICPKGWHVPNENEWNQLINFLVGDKEAGGEMKSTIRWEGMFARKGTISNDFSGLHGGQRNYGGNFDAIGYEGYWWSSTERNAPIATYCNQSIENFYQHNYDKTTGLSCRCVKN